jgi:hypothetical protein
VTTVATPLTTPLLAGAAAPLIEMRGISKAFGAIQALAKVDLRLMPGEILGLVGVCLRIRQGRPAGCYRRTPYRKQ